MKKFLIIYFLIFFSSSVFAEIIVCKENFYKTYFKYNYFEIDDLSKELRKIKTFYTGEDYEHDRFYYSDKKIDELMPYDSYFSSEPFKILHFSKNEIIFIVMNQKEIGEANKLAEIENKEITKENEDGSISLTKNYYILMIDTHTIFHLDRVMGFLLTTGIKVNEDGSYKLTDKGDIDIIERKTIKCYGKNFIKE